MKFSQQSVLISQITGNNLARSKRTPEHQERLNASVQKFGILQPLIIQSRNGKSILIAGFGRLEAAIAAGLTEVPAQVFEGDLPPLDLLILACQENNVREGMSFLDQVDALEKIIKGKRITDTEAGNLIGLKQSVTSKIMSANKRLADDVRLALSQNGYGYSFAYPLSKASHEEQRELFKKLMDGMTREQLEAAVKPDAKQTLRFGDAVSITLNFPKTASYEVVSQTLAECLKEIKRRESQAVPLSVLSKVMS